jgi:hypothetical protein
LKIAPMVQPLHVFFIFVKRKINTFEKEHKCFQKLFFNSIFLADVLA